MSPHDPRLRSSNCSALSADPQLGARSRGAFATLTSNESSVCFTECSATPRSLMRRRAGQTGSSHSRRTQDAPSITDSARWATTRLQQIERRRLDELEGRIKEKLLADDEAADSQLTGSQLWKNAA